MTSSLSRRRLLGVAAAAAGAGLLGPAAVARAADVSAADPPADPPPADPVPTDPVPTELPQAGQRFTLDVAASGAALVVDRLSPPPVLKFTGTWTLEITEAHDADERARTYRTVDLALQSRHPQFGWIVLRTPEGGGTGTLQAQDDGSVLDLWAQPMVIAFERCGDDFGPFTFVSRQPAEWAGSLSAYPPPVPGGNADGSPAAGALYRVAGPVDFGVDPARPNPPADDCLLLSPLPEQPATAREDEDPVFVRLRGMDVLLSSRA
ncbi:hypothetical protein ACGFX4_36125 [Kitasatospora sp. NPDC048365]|uniref:hypothetical protein n=1 Tax=Kitasatospora sp. NPDC048365 TaxID=3364050 RepID=UPI0037188687